MSCSLLSNKEHDIECLKTITMLNSKSLQPYRLSVMIFQEGLLIIAILFPHLFPLQADKKVFIRL